MRGSANFINIIGILLLIIRSMPILHGSKLIEDVQSRVNEANIDTIGDGQMGVDLMHWERSKKKTQDSK